MDWDRFFVLYGPPITKTTTVLAVLWLVWFTRRNKPIMPKDVPGWFKLLLAMGIIVVFREALLFGIMGLNMLLLAIVWLIWYTRRSRSNRPQTALGWLNLLVALGLLVGSQGVLHHLNLLKTNGDSQMLEFHGQLAPDIRFIQVDNGSEHSLSEFRGKVILLNFWRTSCLPCTEQMIHFETLYERYWDEEFIVINLSIEGVDRILTYLDQNPMKTIHASLDGMPQDVPYGINSVPDILIIDREGIIRHTYSGGPRQYGYFISGIAPYL